jgi:hypothetical protein
MHALKSKDSALTSRGEVVALLLNAYLGSLSKACPTHFALLPNYNMVSHDIHCAVGLPLILITHQQEPSSQ